MTQDERKRTGLPALTLFVILALMPLMYLASTGPICGLSHRGYLGPNGGYFLACVYAPVEWATGKSQWFTIAMVHFIRPWMPTEAFLPGPNGEVTPVFGPY